MTNRERGLESGGITSAQGYKKRRRFLTATTRVLILCPNCEGRPLRGPGPLSDTKDLRLSFTAITMIVCAKQRVRFGQKKLFMRILNKLLLLLLSTLDKRRKSLPWMDRGGRSVRAIIRLFIVILLWYTDEEQGLGSNSGWLMIR